MNTRKTHAGIVNKVLSNKPGWQFSITKDCYLVLALAGCIPAPFEQSARGLSGFMFKHGLLKSLPRFEDLADGGFLSENTQ